ncbi:hypothetical protein GCM10027199_71950 [Amycolatopsis magusensis]
MPWREHPVGVVALKHRVRRLGPVRPVERVGAGEGEQAQLVVRRVPLMVYGLDSGVMVRLCVPSIALTSRWNSGAHRLQQPFGRPTVVARS